MLYRMAIEGVAVKRLNRLTDERGFLMEMLRADDSIFHKFGQVYVTVCNPGYVKGWHLHRKQTDNFVVVKGNGRVGLCDMRAGSRTKGEVMEFTLGEGSDLLVTIPPGVAHGIECIGAEPCYLINTPTEPYNQKEPDEVRLPFDTKEIPFKWKAKKGG
jgi:dTDP-4-dehydrorhamnose 3,5-epimerase